MAKAKKTILYATIGLVVVLSSYAFISFVYAPFYHLLAENDETEYVAYVSEQNLLVDDTGVGPGFSGSPITCPGADGTPRIIGAITETIGAYGGKTVLVTPIQAILGESVDPPQAAAISTLPKHGSQPKSHGAQPSSHGFPGVFFRPLVQAIGLVESRKMQNV